MLLPLGVGILTGILVHEEEEAGNFYGLLQCSRKRSSLYLGKFSAALVFLTGSTFLTTLIISTGLCFLLQKERGVGLFLTAACLAVCGVLPVLAVHLWISFAFGMGASVGVGICGLLLAVLLGSTSLSFTKFLFSETFCARCARGCLWLFYALSALSVVYCFKYTPYFVDCQAMLHLR